MITGRVVNREPIVRLTFGRAVDSSITTDALIDTGYTDFLTLPADLFDRLAEGTIDHGELQYADKRIGMHELATVAVHWNGEIRSVTAAKLEEVPLIGMDLLRGYRLTIDTVEDGRVLIEPLVPTD